MSENKTKVPSIGSVDSVKMPAQSEKTTLDELKKRQHEELKSWLVFMTMAIFRDRPRPAQVLLHGVADRIYVRAVWAKECAIAVDGQVNAEYADFIISRIVNFNFNPGCQLEVPNQGLGDEWPPRERIEADLAKVREEHPRIQLASEKDLARVVSSQVRRTKRPRSG